MYGSLPCHIFHNSCFYVDNKIIEVFEKSCNVNLKHFQVFFNAEGGSVWTYLSFIYQPLRIQTNVSTPLCITCNTEEGLAMCIYACVVYSEIADVDQHKLHLHFASLVIQRLKGEGETGRRRGEGREGEALFISYKDESGG